MNQTLIEYVLEIDADEDYHMARLLILLDIISGRNHTKKVDGITKLAKLDFLLTYPTALQRALIHIGKTENILNIKHYERENIESKMTRFKFSPWDKRYRRILSIIEAKGLITMEVSGRKVEVGITDMGHSTTASYLLDNECFKDYVIRSKIIKTNFDVMSPSKLTEFIYIVFPEFSNMKWEETIIL